jgi:hypothetical protein
MPRATVEGDFGLLSSLSVDMVSGDIDQPSFLVPSCCGALRDDSLLKKPVTGGM